MDYKTIKTNYERGLWNKAMVEIAARKGVITPEQRDAIFSGEDVADDEFLGELERALQEGVNSI